MVRVSTILLVRRSHPNRAPNQSIEVPARRFAPNLNSSTGADGASSAATTASSCVPSTFGTSESFPARTRDQAWRRALCPMTSMRACGQDNPTSVASVNEVTWSDNIGKSEWTKSSSVAGASPLAAKERNSCGPGCTEASVVAFGRCFASGC
jgi:hypothetical protein